MRKLARAASALLALARAAFAGPDLREDRASWLTQVKLTLVEAIETNPQEPPHRDHKYYAPGVGLVKEEENLVLVRYGKK